MSKLAMFATFLAILAVASEATAQRIGLSFDEANTKVAIDGRSDLILDPYNYYFPTAVVYVIAYDIPEVFGYEYNVTSTDATGLWGRPVIWPSVGANFATIQGDVRVGTGICFQAGSSEAGPDPTQIRLARHTFAWATLPWYDVVCCIHPSQASVNDSGATAPQYTECVANPVALPFGVAPEYANACISDGCILVVFEWEADGVTPVNCVPEPIGTPAPSTSWGALKAAY